MWSLFHDGMEDASVDDDETEVKSDMFSKLVEQRLV